MDWLFLFFGNYLNRIMNLGSMRILTDHQIKVGLPAFFGFFILATKDEFHKGFLHRPCILRRTGLCEETVKPCLSALL